MSPIEEAMRRSIYSFLEKTIPPSNACKAHDVTDALLAASRQYERYAARASEWKAYSKRQAKLKSAAGMAKDLVERLINIDIVSRDELEIALGADKLAAVIGSLSILHREFLKLSGAIQKTGKPKDIAEEKWIHRVADIYESAFDRRASVWGSGTGPTNQRGLFFQLLKACQPTSFVRYGSLNPRQVTRVLGLRRGRLSSRRSVRSS